MYCSNCGKQIPDKSAECPYCGAKLSITLNNSQGVTPKSKFTLPTWSMILGFASILFSWFTAIPSIIIGIKALKRIKNENLPGKNKAITGIVVSSLIIALSLIAIITNKEEFFKEMNDTLSEINKVNDIKQETNSQIIDITQNGILKLEVKNDEDEIFLTQFITIENNKVSESKTIEGEKETVEDVISSDVKQDNQYIYIYIKYENSALNTTIIIEQNFKLDRSLIGEWQNSALTVTGIINGAPGRSPDYYDVKIVSYERL